MKLSIIIPVYNVEKYLSNCLDSLLRQGLDLSEYEIIAINDGSTDNSLNILNHYSNSFSNIHIHNHINKGPGAIRNIGMDLAQGEYLYFIDSDDYLVDNSLSLIISIAFKYDLDVLSFDTTLTDSLTLKNSAKELPEISSLKIMTGHDYLNKLNYRNEVWWYIIKKDHVFNLGEKLVEHRWLEDAIFTVRIFLNSKRIMHIPIDFHRYLKRSSSITTINKDNFDDLKMIRDMVEVVKDYEFVIDEVKALEFDDVQALDNKIKTKQESFVFFMMIRMLKSQINFDEVRSIINEVTKKEAYPMNLFSKGKNTSFLYSFLSKLFNLKKMYFFLFKVFNPILRR